MLGCSNRYLMGKEQSGLVRDTIYTMTMTSECNSNLFITVYITATSVLLYK